MKRLNILYVCPQSPDGKHDCTQARWPSCTYCGEPLFQDKEFQLYCYVHLIQEEAEPWD